MKVREALPPAQEPAAALAAVTALRRLANQLELDAVTEAISEGWTWAQVGQALDISAQAAHKKFAAEVRARRGS
ncbi:helix-turn-helix domain-containing protein [Nocardioides glacieisoli]|uniref:Helix-turn-helix domain-containing protein n=1 Tax=Nocardioides glacieisoli TaxID=1168730 RepID=A0A4Q2S342_9ACTN|nr:helix-turn-helix domain-containing protein [Nocardioides glacieisoli]RYB96047.1 helix-turn-helix domain-containing protein [Nocardioides glacieisoli]